MRCSNKVPKSFTHATRGRTDSSYYSTDCICLKTTFSLDVLSVLKAVSIDFQWERKCFNFLHVTSINIRFVLARFKVWTSNAEKFAFI